MVPQKYFVAVINDPLYSKPHVMSDQDRSMLGADAREMDFYEYWIRYVQHVYGKDLAGNDYEYNMALGITGPQPLTHSGEHMRALINHVFDLAEKFDIAVYFQLDDMINYDYNNGCTAPSYYDDPMNLEWYAFPDADGGVKPANMWFKWSPEWDEWRANPGLPCFNSPGFRRYMDAQTDEILPVFKERYERLVSMGREYLYAGTAIGWETHFIDNTHIHKLVYEDGNPNPRNRIPPYQTMQEHEMERSGYAALHWLGYDQEKLEQEAEQAGLSVSDHMTDLLSGVQQEYSSYLAKKFFDIGTPRHKIFTHIISADTMTEEFLHMTEAPAISTAVNPYSIPGFTMSIATSPYNLDIMWDKIHAVDPGLSNFALCEGYAQGYRENEHLCMEADGITVKRDANGNPRCDEDSFNSITKTYFSEQFEKGCLISAIFGWAGRGDADGDAQWLGCPKNPDDRYNRLIIQYLRVKRSCAPAARKSNDMEESV